MAIYEAEINGQTYEIDVPEGQDPALAARHAGEMIRSQRTSELAGPPITTPQPQEAPGIGNRILTGLTDIPEQLIGGALSTKSLFAPPPLDLATLLATGKGLVEGVTGGVYQAEPPANEAENEQRTRGRILGGVLPFAGGVKLAQGLLGLGRGAASILTGAGLGAAAPLSRGEPGEALQGAVTGAGSVGVLEALGRAPRTAERLAFSPATPLLEQKAGQLASARATEQFKTEAQQLVQRTGKFGRTSPLVESFKQPEAALYKFLDDQTTPLELTNVRQAATENLAKMEGVPAGALPSTITKVQKELIGGEAGARSKAEVQAWIKNLGETQGPARAQLAQILVDLQTGAPMPIPAVQTTMQFLGESMRRGQNSVSGPAGQLYHMFSEDLKAAATKGNASAQQLLDANRVVRRNRATEELSDIVTRRGTGTIDAAGTPDIDLQKIRNTLDTKKTFGGKGKTLLKDEFTPEQLDLLSNTLDKVFHLQERAAKAAKEIPSGKAKAGVLTRHPYFAGKALLGMSGLGGIAGFVAGGPVGALGGALSGAVGSLGTIAGMEVIANYPRLIFKIAQRKGGADFLEKLYADAPPRFGQAAVMDMAKIQALQNFMQSTGEDQ